MEEMPSDKEICYVISNYDNEMTHLQQEITGSYVLLAQLLNDEKKDDIISAISMPGVNENGRIKDLGQVLDSYERFVKAEVDRTRIHIRELVSRYERYAAIMDSYRMLPEKEMKLLNDLVCSRDDPDVTYMNMAKEQNCSYRTIIRQRRAALDIVLRNYRRRQKKEIR